MGMRRVWEGGTRTLGGRSRRSVEERRTSRGESVWLVMTSSPVRMGLSLEVERRIFSGEIVMGTSGGQCRSYGWGLALGLLLAAPAFAWVYPEHRDIAVLGVQVLDEIRMRGEAEVAIGGAEFCGGEEDGESGGASGFELIIWGVFD